MRKIKNMNNKPIRFSKKVEPTGDLCVKFTDEEMTALGIKAGDKFSFHEDKEGILLKKYATIDIDLSEFSREVLEYLVQESCSKDITVNEVVEQILLKLVDEYATKN
jgi:bifunctional DNA-binding transcriptional regulator/antitoxin component of YhaV-PrlF toxin-antitoxin module